MNINIVKLLKEENAQKILQQGPWFVNGFFLSVKGWHPNFVASEARDKHRHLSTSPETIHGILRSPNLGKGWTEANQDGRMHIIHV